MDVSTFRAFKRGKWHYLAAVSIISGVVALGGLLSSCISGTGEKVKRLSIEIEGRQIRPEILESALSFLHLRVVNQEASWLQLDEVDTEWFVVRSNLNPGGKRVSLELDIEDYLIAPDGDAYGTQCSERNQFGRTPDESTKAYFRIETNGTMTDVTHDLWGELKVWCGSRPILGHDGNLYGVGPAGLVRARNQGEPKTILTIERIREEIGILSLAPWEMQVIGASSDGTVYFGFRGTYGPRFNSIWRLLLDGQIEGPLLVAKWSYKPTEREIAEIGPPAVAPSGDLVIPAYTYVHSGRDLEFVLRNTLALWRADGEITFLLPEQGNLDFNEVAVAENGDVLGVVRQEADVDFFSFRQGDYKDYLVRYRGVLR